MQKINLVDAMVWWNDGYDAARHKDKARIAVLPRMGGKESLMYLSNSAGACDGGWESLGDVGRACRILAIYCWATGRDGVPSDEAHMEFMRIKEYAEWRTQETGPFSLIYNGDVRIVPA